MTERDVAPSWGSLAVGCRDKGIRLRKWNGGVEKEQVWAQCETGWLFRPTFECVSCPRLGVGISRAGPSMHSL